jgi:hypothetical protein
LDEHGNPVPVLSGPLFGRCSWPPQILVPPPALWRNRELSDGKRKEASRAGFYCGNADQPEAKLPKLVQYHAGAYQVVSTTRLRVPNAAGGWRYDLSGADGRDHTFINVSVIGQDRPDLECDQELDLVINAPGDVADTIVRTLAVAR